MKKINEWWNELNPLQKTICSIGIVIGMILVLVIFAKLLPYIALILFLGCYICYVGKKKDQEERWKEQINMVMQQQCIRECYEEMASILIVVLQQFSKELGVKLTTAESIMYSKNYYNIRNNILSFRFALRRTGEPEGDLNTLLKTIQFSVDQHQTFVPIWVINLVKKEGYIDLYALWDDSILTNELRKRYIQNQQIKHNNLPNMNDKDF